MKIFGILTVGWLLFSATNLAPAADWPRFRGNDLLASSSDPMRTNWADIKPSILWSTNSANYGSVAVANGIAYYCGGNQCYAVKAGSGLSLWSVLLYGAGDSTPTIVDGRLYAYSSDKLTCLDATTGKKLWETSPMGSSDSQSPWIEGGRVFISNNSSTNNIKAFDATNGTLLWQSQAIPHTYGSPVGATIQGMRQILFPAKDGVIAVAPDTGQRLWSYQTNKYSYWNQGPSPVACGDIVLVGSKTIALKISSTNGQFKAKPIWTNSYSGSYYTTIVSHNGCAFISAGEYLSCREIETGHLNWETNLGPGTIILADGHLLLTGWDTSLILANPNPERYEEICRCPPLNGKTNVVDSDIFAYLNTPAYANGYLFIRPKNGTFCVDLDPQPAMALTLAATNRVAQLSVRQVNGWDLAKSRATNLVLLCTTNPALPLAEWTPAGAMTWKNGALTKRLVLVSDEPAWFYQVTNQTH